MSGIGRIDFVAINAADSSVTCQIPFETEIEPRAVTRREPMKVRFLMVCEHTDIDITNSLPFDGATLWVAKYITGLEIGDRYVFLS